MAKSRKGKGTKQIQTEQTEAVQEPSVPVQEPSVPSWLPSGTKIVVLNLPDRNDRLEQITDELTKAGITGWERFDGVRDEVGWKGFNRAYYNLFTTYKDVEHLLVLEDDCQFEPDISHLKDVFWQLPDNYDALWLGANLQTIHTDQVSTNLFRYVNGWTTHAVLWSKRFRDWILANWNPDKLVLDEWIRVNALRSTRCYVAYPLLAIQRPSKSDINGKFEDYKLAWEQSRSRFITSKSPETTEKKEGEPVEVALYGTTPQRRKTARKLNVVFNLHSYVPDQMSGAEVMAHRMAKFLVECGHDVTVLCPWEDKVVDGVKVKRWEKTGRWPEQDREIYKKCDVILTHLGQTMDSLNKAMEHRKPIVHIVHNTFKMMCVDAKTVNNYCVYNSEWAREVLGYKHPYTILNPPTDYRDFEGVEPDKQGYITLVNLNENKGGKILPELAKLMPEYKFLGVRGGYDHQHMEMCIPNLEYVGQHPDIRDLLRKTRILIMPSNYESWGLIAVEAMASGVPVIANPTPGLESSLGPAGIWADRNDLDAWVKAIKSLDDKKRYEQYSKAGRERAKELDPTLQLEKFEQFLQWVVKQPLW